MPYKDPAARRAYAAKHYQENLDIYQSRSKGLRTLRENFVKNLKEASPCTDCNVLYLACQMQYDHIADDKVDSISNLVRKGTMQQIVNELQKCELVCSNCHALRTWNRKRKS